VGKGAGICQEGVTEIWLTSEDTGAYGLDIGSNIAKLLHKADPCCSLGYLGLRRMFMRIFLVAHPRVKPTKRCGKNGGETGK
jgi:hypothetical protein